jgi:hypothetical protein
MSRAEKCDLKARGRREGDNGTAEERMEGESARKKLCRNWRKKSKKRYTRGGGGGMRRNKRRSERILLLIWRTCILFLI